MGRSQSSWKGWRWIRWFLKPSPLVNVITIFQVADTCTMILKKFLADPMIPKPKSCLFTSWYSQPYTGGSYTAIGTGGTQVPDLFIYHIWWNDKMFRRTLRRLQRHCTTEGSKSSQWSDLLESTAILLFTGWFRGLVGCFVGNVVECDGFCWLFEQVQLFACLDSSHVVGV